MNTKKMKLLIFGVLISGLFAGCTTAGAGASSWPGIESDAETGYFAYGTQVYAINSKNGSLNWRYPSEPDAKVQFYAAPAVADDQVVAGSYDNSLVALDKSNGFQKWSFNNAKDRYIASPLVVGETVFAPNADKHLYAINSSGDLLWSFKTSGPNWTRPVSDGSKLYLASMDHFLYAFELEYPANSLEIDENGSRTLVEKPLWSVDLGAAVVANPIITEGRILVATIDGKLYCVDSVTGKILWSFSNGEETHSIWGSPAVYDESVFFGNEKGELFAVSLEKGKAIWNEPYDAGSALIAGGIAGDDGVIFVNEQGRIFSINTGKEPKPIVTLDSVMYASPKLADGKILLAPASKEKLFMAIDSSGNEIWSFVPAK